MVLFIAGGTHTGKTLLAQKLLEKYRMPYLSLDHLKMGLIRSGLCQLTPLSPEDQLTAYLWPVAREIAKTAVENDQNLVIEGCYIPFDWQSGLGGVYRRKTAALWLVFSEEYLRAHYGDVLRHADDAESRGDDDCTPEGMLRENRRNLELCRRYGCRYHLIDSAYDVRADLSEFGLEE